MEPIEILELRDPKAFIEDAEMFVVNMNNNNPKAKLSNSQLRKVYDAILNISGYDSPELYLLKPKLAYMQGRKLVTNDFVKKINNLIDKIDNKEHFNNFLKYMEAVVAYNKQHGKD
jgi:CRISPR type III-A-associated protein Csm2